MACSQLHDGEVIEVYDLAALQQQSGITFAAARPADDEVSKAIVRACLPELSDVQSAWIGPGIAAISVQPSGDWGEAPRFVCAVGAATGERMSGSVILE